MSKLRESVEYEPALRIRANRKEHAESSFLENRHSEDDSFWSTAAWTALQLRISAVSADYSLGASPSQIGAGLPIMADMGAIAWRVAKKTMVPDHLHGLYRFGRDVGMYRTWLWLLSLAVALDVEDAVFDDVVAAVEPVWADRLIGLLIQSRRPDFEVGEDFAFKTLGRGLAKAWDAPDPVKALESYLAKWPSYYKREGWTDAAQYAQIEGDRRYFGMWAFETVGVVKALNLDDTRLLSHEYYPAGILHADR